MISKQEKGSTMPKPIGVGVVVANVVVTLSIGVGVVVAQEPWKELAWYLIFSYSMEALVIQWRHPAHCNVFLA